MGGGGGSNFRTLPSIPRAQFQMLDVSGTTDFFPSSWMQFSVGLAEGEAALAARQKTLGELAAEYRRVEKPKAKFVITQDAFGNAVIERR